MIIKYLKDKRFGVVVFLLCKQAYADSNYFEEKGFHTDNPRAKEFFDIDSLAKPKKSLSSYAGLRLGKTDLPGTIKSVLSYGLSFEREINHWLSSESFLRYFQTDSTLEICDLLATTGAKAYPLELFLNRSDFRFFLASELDIHFLKKASKRKNLFGHGFSTGVQFALTKDVGLEASYGWQSLSGIQLKTLSFGIRTKI